MSVLPRATCPTCGKDVAVRVNGALREHYVYRPQAEQQPGIPLGRVRVCEGGAASRRDAKGDNHGSQAGWQEPPAESASSEGMEMER